MQQDVQVLRKIWDRDMEAAKRAWEIKYVVSGKVLNFVVDQLQDYAEKWNRYEWYAPLVALVQSSGWGKSRLICQLWRKGFFVFYISCMGEKQTGFPRRTGKLADILQSSESTEATFVVLVLSILIVLNKHADMTCEQWMQEQEKSNAIQNAIYALFEQRVGSFAHYDQQECAKAEEQFECCLKEEVVKLEQRGVKLLLCIDEAGELRENFVKFRRSLRSIPPGKSFFSIVLGTDRKVADLAAAAEEDGSARVRLATPFNVYHPLYLIGKSNIFAEAGTDSSSEARTSSSRAGISSSGKTDRSMDPKHVIRYGRPLWAAYYDSVEEDNKLMATIQLAKMKLLGQNVNTAKQGWVTRDLAVAVFACIVGLDVVAWGTLPQQLVAKHMRTIVKISEDRRRVYTAAAVEPALAAGAAKLLHAQNDAFLGDFLDKLIEVFLDGLVLEGMRGEVVARIVIMLAMHECTKNSYYIQPVTLATFLETMVGGSIVKKLRANCCSLEEILFFNSFTPTSVEPYKQLLDAAFARCTALVTRRNERVLDYALPCCLGPSVTHGDRPMLPTVKWELKSTDQAIYQGTAVTGQVKNQRGQQSMKKPIEKLQDEDRVSAPVQLFFQIGHRGEPLIEVEHNTVVAYGLDCFEHLKSKKMKESKVLEKLKLLARTCEEVFKDASAQEQAVLQDMIPMGLAPKSFLEDYMEEDNMEEHNLQEDCMEEHSMEEDNWKQNVWNRITWKRTKTRSATYHGQHQRGRH